MLQKMMVGVTVPLHLTMKVDRLSIPVLQAYNNPAEFTIHPTHALAYNSLYYFLHQLG
jgi:hypothetical protein